MQQSQPAEIASLCSVGQLFPNPFDSLQFKEFHLLRGCFFGIRLFHFVDSPHHSQTNSQRAVGQRVSSIQTIERLQPASRRVATIKLSSGILIDGRRSRESELSQIVDPNGLLWKVQNRNSLQQARFVRSHNGFGLQSSFNQLQASLQQPIDLLNRRRVTLSEAFEFRFRGITTQLQHVADVSNDFLNFVFAN